MEGQRLADTLNRDFSGSGHNIHAVFVNHHNPMSQVSSLSAGKDLVVLAGGDGTVSMLAGCLSMLDAPPPFAVIPLGTGNDLARNTGWFRLWREGGLDAFFTALPLCSAESIDIWGIGSDYRFLCYAGIGLDARIISFVDRHRDAFPLPHKLEAQRRFITRIVYGAAALRHLTSELVKGRKQRGRMDFSIRGEHVESVDLHATEVLLIASIDSYAGGGCLYKKASRSDGIFEVYRFPSLMSYIKFLFKTRLGRKFTPEPSFRADNAILPGNSTLNMQLDGEPVEVTTTSGSRTLSLHRVIPILIPPDDLAARARIRKKSPSEKEVKAEISPVIPGAASASQMRDQSAGVLPENHKSSCRK